MLGLFALVAILACNRQAATIEETTPVEEKSTAASMEGFSWIVAGELAAMPVPGRDRPLREDALFLQQQEIGTLISLTEELPDPGIFEEMSISQAHIPVEDFTAPTLEQMIEFITVVSESAQRGQPVGVHCTAGLGRSGAMSAAYLVAQGLSAEEAIATVRQLRPGSIETEAQEDAVKQAEVHFSAGR